MKQLKRRIVDAIFRYNTDAFAVVGLIVERQCSHCRTCEVAFQRQGLQARFSLFRRFLYQAAYSIRLLPWCPLLWTSRFKRHASLTYAHVTPNSSQRQCLVPYFGHPTRYYKCELI